MFKKLLLPSVIGAILLPATSFADETQDQEFRYELEREGFFYMGARAGMSDFKDLCDENAKDCEDQDVGYSGYAGYQFKEWLALEVTAGSYGSPDLDRKTETGQTVRTNEEVLGAEVTAKITAVEVGDDLDVYTRLGGAYQEVNSSSEYGDMKYDRSGPIAAIGLEYDLTNQLSVRAEYEYLYFLGENSKVFEDSDMQFASIGLNYKFRESRAIPLPVVQRPVEPPPPPEPKLIVINEAEGVGAIFDFDSAVLNDISRIEPIVPILLEAKGDIVIRAHTDSIGTEEYNQRLSERRAQSAVNYFTSKGVEASRIRAIGMGEGHPVADNKTKEGRAQNRRLEIEYTLEKIEQ